MSLLKSQNRPSRKIARMASCEKVSSSQAWIVSILVLSMVVLECSATSAVMDRTGKIILLKSSAESPSSSKPEPASKPTSPPLDGPAEAEAKLKASKMPLAIAFAGLALYSLLGLLTLVAMIFPPQRALPTRQSQIVQRLFSVLVIIFCIVRLVYFCFPIAHVSESVTYAVNQTAFMVFFTMFSLIIFFWAEQYHRKFYDTQSMLPRLRNIFIGTNVALWVLEIVLIVVAVVLHQVPAGRLSNDPDVPPMAPSSISPIVTVAKHTNWLSSIVTTPAPSSLTPSTGTKGASLGGPTYFASMILIIVVDTIFAIGFVIYGVAIFIQKYTYALGSGLSRELITTMIVTITFGCCFSLRTIMFLYRPVTGKFMNPVLYRVLAYFVPEVVAVLLQVFVVYLMNHNPNGSHWKRPPRNTGSIQHATQDDEYYTADQDLRASAMPAPLANAHQRLISPPRPLRTNFSTPATGASASSSHSVAASQSLPPSASPAASPQRPNPLHSGLPVAIASHQHTRIGSPLHSTSPPGGRSFTPASFSPGHDQPLAFQEPILPLQHLDNDPGSSRLTDASDDSESVEIEASDSASLLSPNRKVIKRY